MVTKIMKWVSIPVLLVASMFSSFATSYETLVNVAICVGAVVLAAWAARLRNYIWAAGFVTVGVVFSPLLLVVKIFLLLVFICIAAFVTLLTAFRTPMTPAG